MMIRISINVIKSIFAFARKQASFFIIGAIISSTISPLLLLATEHMINNAISTFQSGISYDELFGWVLVVVALEVLSYYMKYFNEKGAQRLKKKLYGEYSDELLFKYSTLNFKCFEHSKSRDIINHVGNSPQDILLSYFRLIIMLISHSISAIGYVTIFFRVSPYFGILGLLALALLLYFNNKRVKMMTDLYDAQTEDERKADYLSSILSDKHSLIDLKINLSIPYIEDKRRLLISNILKERIKRTVKSQFVYSIGTTCLVIWLSLVISFIIIHAITGTMTYGMVVALLGATQSVYACFDGISNDFAELSKSRVNIKYLHSFMALPNIEQESEADINEKKRVHIVFQDVSFCYPDTNKYVLQNVSFCIDSTQRIALVGENGSGKTTLIKLLCGFYTPTSGKILINGIPSTEISQECLSDIFSVVFQDYCKYKFKLRENVAIGNAEHINDDIKLSNVLEQCLIGELKDRMDLPIGNIEENGIDLSVGQWQKVALSRACFRDSTILILDEPTASIDPMAENELYTDFLRLMSHTGCIIVSHRLAIAKQVDKILVLEDGMVVQEGTHDELCKSAGLYKSMFDAQSHWYKCGNQ